MLLGPVVYGGFLKWMKKRGGLKDGEEEIKNGGGDISLCIFSRWVDM
jgi:hypothetical protein